MKIGDKLLVDPNLAEINAMDARVTIGTFEKDGTTYISSMQKGGKVGITEEELDHIITLAQRKGNELRKLLED